MLFLIMGASGSGKSSSLTGLKQQRPDIDWRDFDDAPKHPTSTAERQLTTEYWLRVATQNQKIGISTGIVGTIVLG
jgi:ABC-type lipoprotein export system ATPase subunit